MIDYKFILVIVIAYFMGNISPSTIQAKKSGVDIKSEGSGNAGTTNAFRVFGAKVALITQSAPAWPPHLPDCWTAERPDPAALE